MNQTQIAALFLGLYFLLLLLNFVAFQFLPYRRRSLELDSGTDDDSILQRDWEDDNRFMALAESLSIWNWGRELMDKLSRWIGHEPGGQIQLPLTSPNPNTRDLEPRSSPAPRGYRHLGRLGRFLGLRSPTAEPPWIDQDAERENENPVPDHNVQSSSDSSTTSQDRVPNDASGGAAEPSSHDSASKAPQNPDRVDDTLDEAELIDIAQPAGLGVDQLRIQLGTGLSREEIRKLRRKETRDGCTDEFEMMLWNKLIFPETITTTYSQVHVPESTIKTLKSSSFLLLDNQGLWTRDLLGDALGPGVILYGPPGTGKTKLVQALAKDCEAAVLSISGADPRSKWVGEDVKAVRAMFSLARKLSPCIIFIDEDDSICSKRSSSDAKYERAFLEQFLQEWDGFVRDSNDRILVAMATNRPWDLDDAILRRAPAGVLVDTPAASDREAILKIHLQGQHLAPDVNLAEIALRTANYTNSDINSLCKAAITSSLIERAEQMPLEVHEGTDQASALTSCIATTARPKTIQLTAAHFETALQQVCSSVNSSSLSLIHQFHASRQCSAPLSTPSDSDASDIPIA